MHIDTDKYIAEAEWKQKARQQPVEPSRELKALLKAQEAQKRAALARDKGKGRSR